MRYNELVSTFPPSSAPPYPPEFTDPTTDEILWGLPEFPPTQDASECQHSNGDFILAFLLGGSATLLGLSLIGAI
jgi:hypothetical protein